MPSLRALSSVCPASLNLSSYDLTPIAHAIAVAAQTYGFVVNDSSPTPTLTMRLGRPALLHQCRAAGSVHQRRGVAGVDDENEGLLDGGAQNAVMANFPWYQLQALPYDYEPS